MTLLRFSGQQPVSFMSQPYLGEVEPGEFEARDGDAEVLLLRRDIEAVDAESAPDLELAADVPAADTPALPADVSAEPAPVKPRRVAAKPDADA